MTAFKTIFCFALFIAAFIFATAPSSFANTTFANTTRHFPDPTFSHPGNCVLAFPNARLCANIVWNSQPQVNQPAAFRLQFKSMDTSAPTEPAVPFTVDVWMPAMGHGSSPVTIIHVGPDPSDAKANVGAFDVTNVFFTMDGAWQVRVHLTNGSSAPESAATDVQI